MRFVEYGQALSIHVIASTLEIHKIVVHKIIGEYLAMKKIYEKLVPKVNRNKPVRSF